MNSDVTEIRARSGKAVHVDAGTTIEIINTHGHQVVDFWAFQRSDLSRYLSMQHCRAAFNRLWPKSGDMLVDNERRPFLKLEHDSSPGKHDTIIPPCDAFRYQLLGCSEYHANCVDNMYAALKELGISHDFCPASLNLWMNIPVGEDGGLDWSRPLSRPGDSVIFRPLTDIVAVMSACPQDIIPINAGEPVSAHYRLLDQSDGP